MPLDRPIPAFYCCYLLRSTVRHGNVYVGSTPNPVRRLRQHNGETKGGAARTNRSSLRPWEMSCIVTGFPSHIAALQFEWAWQNPHITLHIPSESRIQHSTAKKRSGHPKRPRHSVTSLLSNLHILLRVPSFSRWPLEVRFFSEDVHKAWLKWTNTASNPIRGSLPIIKDFPPAILEPSDADTSPRSKKQKDSHGISALDVNYSNNKAHVEKGKAIVDFEREGSCAICRADLEHNGGIYTICPNIECEAVTHVNCLSKHFLSCENDDEAVLPIKGTCPSCRIELAWVDIVKELTLRMRGQKEVEKLLKKKRVPKGKAAASQAAVESSEDDDMEEEEEEEEEEAMNDFVSATAIDDGDVWHEIDDSNSDAESIISNASVSLPKLQPQAKKPASQSTKKAKQLPIVIEDSDWDEAETID